MRLRTNVLVVGGGPGGATAARYLAENKIDVILLEKNLSFVKPCGGGVPSSAFNEFSLPKKVIKKIIKNITIVSPKNERLDIELKGGHLNIVERGEFDRVLRDLAKKLGTEIIEGDLIHLVDSSPYKVIANLNGSKVEIISEYIIAADGVNSKIRTCLGIKPNKALFSISDQIKGISIESCEFWFSSYHAPNFYSWVFPSSEGISVGTGTPIPGTIHTILKRFKDRIGLLSEGQKRVYRIPLWSGELYNRGKILFVGDSAGHVMPLTYEGIYYAMKAGKLASIAIIEKKVENYKRMWKDKFYKRFQLMHKLKNYFYKDDDSAEKLVALHKRKEVQEASMRLWLRKDSGKLGLKDYLKLFGKFLC